MSFEPKIQQPPHQYLKAFVNLIPLLIFPTLFGHMAYSDWGAKPNGNRDCYALTFANESFSIGFFEDDPVLLQLKEEFTEEQKRRDELSAEERDDLRPLGRMKNVTAQIDQLVKYGFITYLLWLMVLFPSKIVRRFKIEAKYGVKPLPASDSSFIYLTGFEQGAFLAFVINWFTWTIRANQLTNSQEGQICLGTYLIMNSGKYGDSLDSFTYDQLSEEEQSMYNYMKGDFISANYVFNIVIFILGFVVICTGIIFDTNRQIKQIESQDSNINVEMELLMDNDEDDLLADGPNYRTQTNVTQTQALLPGTESIPTKA